MTAQRKRNADLIVAIGWALVVAAYIATGWQVPVLGVALTLPLALLLPGYAITQATFARRVGDLPELLLMSLGLSLVADIIGGLLLNLTPMGLHASSWTVYLALVTIAGSLAAGWVRNTSIRPMIARRQLTHLKVREGVAIGLALVIVTLAFAISNTGARAHRDNGATQFWMLPGQVTSQGASVAIGVSNQETADVTYNVALTVDGVSLETWDMVTLRSGETWQQVVSIPASLLHGNDQAQAMLYRADAPQSIYRHTLLWISAPTLTASAQQQFSAADAARGVTR